MNAPAGLSQAALMVLLFEEADATAILSELNPEELRLLGQEMAGIDDVAPEQIDAAIAAFADNAEPKPMPPAASDPARIRALFEGAVGPVKAGGLLRGLEPPPSPGDGSLALLRWLDLEALLTLVDGENPQVVAVLLCQLEAQVAAQVLARLPQAIQSDVVHRIATLGPVAPEAMTLLSELTERRLEQCFGALPLSLGGIPEAAAIINQTARTLEKRVMPELGKRDRAVAKKVEQAMFRFEMLYELDAKMIGAVLREVDSIVLIDAMKGLEEDRRELFFAAMSARAADGVRDEIEARGRVKLAEVEAAQQAIIAAARRLAADGTIVFGAGDDDYV